MRRGSPGKRTATERLPPGAGERSPGGSDREQPDPAGGDVDDAMWWLDGPGHDGEAAPGGGGGGGGGGGIDPGTMRSLYYGINPPRHAEKAYQASDPAPPLHPRPTTVGKSGTIVALATTIYNRPPFGRPAQFSICDRGGSALRTLTVVTPGKVEVTGFAPGTEVLIRPETVGTMVKLLTPEQIAGASDHETAEHGGAGAGGGAGARAGGAGGEGDGEGGGGTGAIDPGTMHSLYYGINPPRHAEKAYQASDPAPPLHPRPTTVGKSGTIVALATTIYNRPPFGKRARFSICDRSGRALHTATVATPGRLDVPGFQPGQEVLVRPETMGTMVKLLTPEQIAGAADDLHPPGGGHGHGGGGAGRRSSGEAGTGEAGTGEGDAADVGTGTIDPGTMHSLYYGINPRRHAEKAYQPDDPAPPLHPRPTTVGRSGTIVALATTVYNKPPFGKLARFSICDRGGTVLHSASVATPGKLDIPGFQPGQQVLIRPETVGTMVKLLTPEQIAAGGDPPDQP